MKFVKLPKKDRRTGRVIGVYYQFRTYNPKTQRTEPVPVALLPDYIRKCESDEIAEAYCRSRDSEEHALKARILKRKEWESRFADFGDRLHAFGEQHKERAPNSWKNDVYYLETYVFPFFLGKQLSNNVPEWPLHYTEFKTWLKTVKPMKYKIDRLAVNTQNKVIKALNLYLKFYGNQNPTNHEIKKCEVYSRDLCATSDADDILDENEIALIWSALRTIRPLSADFFYVLTRTGMRISECLGLSPAFITVGEMAGNKSRNYHQLVAKYGLSYKGYICLESQPSLLAIRDEHGAVPRKPLKGRKVIHPEWFRHIPIFDAEAWRIVGRLYNKQMDLSDQCRWGKDQRDYLLFDGLTKNVFYADLVKAFKTTKLRFRSPHQIGRHTYLTWLYSVTSNDRTLAEIIAGHRDKRTMENYSHLSEQVGREQLQKATPRKRIIID